MANKYCLAGASGSANGNDWTNAYTTLAALKAGLNRGDTGYVGVGAYTSMDCDTPLSGTTRITIKKATVADHGTSTGWNDAFAAQATLTGGFGIDTGYWTIDGQVGEFDPVANVVTVPFGFQITTGQGATTVSIFECDGIIVRYVEGMGVTSLGDTNYTSGTNVVFLGPSNDATFQHCYFHGGDTLIYMGDGQVGQGLKVFDFLIENCTFQASRSSNPSFHSNVVFCTAATGTFRNNYCFNYNDEGFFVTWYEAIPEDIQIYGNVFSSRGGPSSPDSPRGIELRQFDSPSGSNIYDGFLVYNNTFVALGIGGFLNRATESGNGSSANCAYVNNLAYDSPLTIGDTATVANNTTDGTDRFVDLANQDFQLTANLLPGTDLGSPYNVDINGNTRTTWTRGAFEFDEVAAASLNVTNLNVTTLTVG